MRHGRGALVLAATAALACGAALSGCGGDSDSPPSALRAALATLAPAHVGADGAGFLDVARVREAGYDRELIADAFALGLGPGGDDAFEEGDALEEALGLDPFGASRAVSLGGSYTFGVRLDGVATGEAAQRLRASRNEAPAPEPWTLYDVGRERSVPARLADSGLGPRAARVALDPGRAVFASIDRARGQLMSTGRSLLDDPATSLAADCLGDAVSARIVPGRLVIARDVGAELVAAGILADGRERACFAGSPGAPLLRDPSRLERAFDLERRDPVTRRPIGDEVAAVGVELLSADEAAAARVELTLAPDTRPGHVLRSLNTGALVAYVGHEGLFRAREPEE